MRVTAYVLAADPTWIERSVGAYYGLVDRIVVSYDQDGRGWTGRPIPVAECLDRLARVDVDHKLDLRPGRFSRRHPVLMDDETEQRREALAAAADGADWVLQLDTDEVLADAPALLAALRLMPAEVTGVEWPMRVLYRRLRDGRYLEVQAADGGVLLEFPGAVAVRAGTPLVEARRAGGLVVRVLGDGRVVQREHPDVVVAELGEVVPILHNSWARGTGTVARKISTWGHNEGLRSWKYFALTWLPAPLRWRRMRDLHPLTPSAWPRLGLSPEPPGDDPARHR